MSRSRVGLTVLHDDNHVLAVVKPACVPVVPDESGDESLLDRARAWVKERYSKPGDVFLGVVHRLDRPVSGVVVFARTSKAAARLSEELRSHRMKKEYLGLTEGAPDPPEGELEQVLLKSSDQRRVQVIPPRGDVPQGAKHALTLWRTLAVRKDSGRTVALVRLEPRTGRAHQLRVALSSLRCPLLGDVKYGGSEPLPDRSVALHAWRVVVMHPTLKTPLRLEAQPPDVDWWKWTRSHLEKA